MERQTAKIAIDEVRFDVPVHLPDKQRSDFVMRLKQLEFDADSNWVSEVEVRATLEWQNDGYFRSHAHAIPALIGTDSGTQHYLVTIRVDEGPQYRLGSIRFEHAAEEKALPTFAFPVQTLRHTFRLRDGELFDMETIQKGIQGLSRLYGSKGFIEFTAVPDYDYSTPDQKIVLTVTIGESKQYRVNQVEVIGLEPSLERLLRASVRRGELVNTLALNEFFAKYELDLPSGATLVNTIEIERSVKNDTVSLRFDFTTRSPSASNVRRDLPLSTSRWHSLIPLSDPHQIPTAGEFTFRPSGSDIAFRLVSIGDIFLDNIDGQFMEGRAYEASNGEGVFVYTRGFSSSAALADYVDKKLKTATRIIERSRLTNEKGETIGQRIVAVLVEKESLDAAPRTSTVMMWVWGYYYREFSSGTSDASLKAISAFTTR